MREPAQDHGRGRCSAFEFLDIKALLSKTGCVSGSPLPGQRITPLPAVSQHPSILRRTTYSSTQPNEPRRVKFDLPPGSFTSDEGSEGTVSHDATGSDEGYIGANARRKHGDALEHAYAMKFRVQQIPQPCLRELLELGALDRVLITYSRDIGCLAIDSFRPFRSLYFYGIVMYHLGKQRAVDFDEAANICEAAVVLNNATAPTSAQPRSRDPPSLLSFLDINVELNGNLTMPRADGAALHRSSWCDLNQTRMDYAMTAGRLVANLDEPAVRRCLEEHVAQRCIIRPVFDYMFFQFVDEQHTELPVRSESMQFQIYSTVREVMHRAYKGDMPVSYVMYTTLFAIAETNDKIAAAVFSQDKHAMLRSTIVSGYEDDDATVSSAHGDSGLDDPMSLRELLCLLDWDFAAVLGYLLAHRYDEAHRPTTEMRARLGALAFGVDSSKEQPFPPVLPLQDSQFHQFVRDHVASVYARWPHGFFYMVLDEAVDAYNVIIQSIRDRLDQ
ncbi:hypothetical protein H4S01_005634 [Coemansia sp. RSA 2610]|nr:hypothetical protein H4S01_005634 [Coemansia sp. RSA 2610]